MGLRSKTAVNKKSQTKSSDLAAPSYDWANQYQGEQVELDVIERLKSNISMLDNLQKRLGFINNELQNVIGNKKR